METFDVAALAGDRTMLIGALVLTVLALIWVARRVRKISKSERPDEPLSNLAMLIGLGWSSEAIWELTGRIDGMPTQVRILIFFVLEALLILAMIRAKRSMREHGHPGRSGRTAWIVAVVMALVAGFASNSFPEALLRIAIPLLVTNQWWDGLVGEGARKKSSGATSWRWTPRRLLLWLGAIEPGERDVETVHRERLVQQMTQLEFRRRHGSDKQQDRSARRLAKLSLTADDDIVAQVRDRVDRAMWFDVAEQTEPETVEIAPRASVPAADARTSRARRVRHSRSLRRVMVAHPRPVIVAAQAAREDDRTAQERDLAVRAIKEANPALPQRQIARLAALPETTLRQSLRRIKAAGAVHPEKVNGRKPELEKVSS
jgi:hypothetical protein